MEYRLRPAQSSDLAFLQDIEAQAMRHHALALWGHYLPAEPALFDLENTRVVTVGGGDAGNVTVECAPDHLRLRKLYLRPDVQGKGLGSTLLALVGQEAARASLPLRVSVLRPNQRALAFYLAQGLQVVDTTAERVFLMRSFG